MKVGEAIAEIMKREGVEALCGHPVNHLIEHAAAKDIRPVMVRQGRIGPHMADTISRVTSGREVGAFCMQHGPGPENAHGAVARACGESAPAVPMGYPRRPIRRGIERMRQGVPALLEFVTSDERAASRL